MFRSTNPDSKPRRSSRLEQKSRELPSISIAERPYTAFASPYAEEDLKSRLPSNTLKGIKVLWRQSQMTSNLRRTTRDGQMPVEQLSDTSDSSDDSSPNFLGVKQRPRRPKRGQKKDTDFTLVTEEAVRDTKEPELSVALPETKKEVEKEKEVVEVGVQAMRPASIDPLIEGRLTMLESRLRLEEMRSKSWCVRMTEAEDNVRQLQSQVKALSASVNGAGTPNRFPSSSSRERGLWGNNAVEGGKTQRVGAKNSQHLGKDFTAEFNAILQQIRRDNESEELMVGDS